MASITIRDVPAGTHKELTARAALNGLSLQEYLRKQLVEMAHRPDVATVIARIENRVRKSGTRLSAKQILEYRDLDRR
jgi:plasmid stability protein